MGAGAITWKAWEKRQVTYRAEGTWPTASREGGSRRPTTEELNSTTWMNLEANSSPEPPINILSGKTFTSAHEILRAHEIMRALFGLPKREHLFHTIFLRAMFKLRIWQPVNSIHLSKTKCLAELLTSLENTKTEHFRTSKPKDTNMSFKYRKSLTNRTSVKCWTDSVHLAHNKRVTQLMV